MVRNWFLDNFFFRRYKKGTKGSRWIFKRGFGFLNKIQSSWTFTKNREIFFKEFAEDGQPLKIGIFEKKKLWNFFKEFAEDVLSLKIGIFEDLCKNLFQG